MTQSVYFLQAYIIFKRLDGRYTWRHDNVLGTLADILERNIRKPRKNKEGLTFVNFVKEGEKGQKKKVRLEAYASKNLLMDGVNVEKILLRKEPLTQIIGETNHTYSAMSSLVEDRVSRQILNEQSMIIKERNPVQVSTNGNCLFNSLSVDMCGNESLATRLRVLTCIEIVSNKLIYDTSKHNRLELVSPS
ncbi:unnamed protein product [Mytilus edulis]|uniref:OTU domain-containing protein n=1 Tax=Mytilus edulis TaxID=6550 RepID=A0A8S3QUL8_MYTED|nr:unnamed protein product [Mytilus edulis]